ncbi:MAG: hypothetical protein AAFV43_08130 [Planctomycetota bacterium]
MASTGRYPESPEPTSNVSRTSPAPKTQTNAGDRAPRQEGVVKDFQPIALGTIPLERGEQDLTVSVEDGRRGGPEVWLLTLDRIDAP